MENFSDDGLFIRGGYGPRIRKYNGISDDYRVKNDHDIEISELENSEVDQFNYVSKSFEKDVNTRQAIINIGDPPKDCFDECGRLKETIDTPCTRLLHFQKHPIENKLNLTVYMRSNDLMWGASAVNIFNFTFIQEYFAKILNLEIGDYYHMVNNFHYYEEQKDQIQEISEEEGVIDDGFEYLATFTNLSEFDEKLNQLQKEEEGLRTNRKNGLVDFEDDFFNDWFKTFYCFNTKNKTKFINPTLNKLFKKYQAHE